METTTQSIKTENNTENGDNIDNPPLNNSGTVIKDKDFNYLNMINNDFTIQNITNTNIANKEIINKDNGLLNNINKIYNYDHDHEHYHEYKYDHENDLKTENSSGIFKPIPSLQFIPLQTIIHKIKNNTNNTSYSLPRLTETTLEKLNIYYRNNLDFTNVLLITTKYNLIENYVKY